MENTLGIIGIVYSSLPPARTMRVTFLDLHCVNLVVFLQQRLLKVWVPPWSWGPPEVSYSHASPHSASSNSSKWSLRVPTSLWLQQLLLQIIWSLLWIYISRSLNFRVAAFPESSVLWWAQEKHWFFKLFSSFFVLTMGVMTSEPFYDEAETRSL